MAAAPATIAAARAAVNADRLHRDQLHRKMATTKRGTTTAWPHHRSAAARWPSLHYHRAAAPHSAKTIAAKTATREAAKAAASFPSSLCDHHSFLSLSLSLSLCVFFGGLGFKSEPFDPPPLWSLPFPFLSFFVYLFYFILFLFSCFYFHGLISFVFICVCVWREFGLGPIQFFFFISFFGLSLICFFVFVVLCFCFDLH